MAWYQQRLTASRTSTKAPYPLLKDGHLKLHDLLAEVACRLRDEPRLAPALRNLLSPTAATASLALVETSKPHKVLISPVKSKLKRRASMLVAKVDELLVGVVASYSAPTTSLRRGAAFDIRLEKII